MIFAAVDYLKYRFQWGRFSDRTLTAQGWRRATQENIADLVRATLPGQLLLVHPRVSLLSWLIMYGDNQTITSHSGIVGRDGYVIEALTSGVTKRPLMEYADNKSYLIVFDPPLTPSSGRTSSTTPRLLSVLPITG